jgi:hypothetical protein
MYLTLAAIGFSLAWILLAWQAGAAPTWFYVLVWYPTLALFDALAARRGGRPALINEPKRLWSMLLWSAPIWFVFELLNFRLDDWYYVFLPAARPARWIGVTMSFATVVPAVILAERVLEALGVGARWRRRPVRVRTTNLWQAQWVGAAVLIATLTLPRLLYPLVWGAVLLIADPFVYRRRPQLSLFNDLNHGEYGRIGRLMLGGLLVGVLWEGYNYWARGKWIYTVPLFQQLKLFEMPPLGFIGFPFFALEAWALYHALSALKIAAPADYPTRVTPKRLAPAGVLAIGLCALTLVGMDRWTVSSTTPNTPTALERDEQGGTRALDPWTIAALEPGVLARRTGLSADSARLLVRAGQLITLKGIGTTHAAELARAGIFDVCHLGQADPDSLWLWMRQSTAHMGKRPTKDEVRVWVEAAVKHCVN